MDGEQQFRVVAPDGATVDYSIADKGDTPPHRIEKQVRLTAGNKRVSLGLTRDGELTLTKEIASPNAVRVVRQEFHLGKLQRTQVIQHNGTLDVPLERTHDLTRVPGEKPSGNAPRRSWRVGYRTSR